MSYDSERLYRGRLKCSGPSCRSYGHIIEQDKDHTIKAWCIEHRPKDVFDRAAMLETCIHISWDSVTKVTLHDLDQCGDRRGTIITIEMKDVANKEMMRHEGTEVLQFLTIMAGHRYTIHHLGMEGEQNDSWINADTPWKEGPIRCIIRDKYWGDTQIENFRKLVRTMAAIHGWELEDETVPVLDRLVMAIDDTPAPKKRKRTSKK